MSGSKFNQLHVYIIGVVLMIIVGAGMYFLLIKPILEENAAIQGKITSTENQTVAVDGKNFTISQQTAANEALKEAKARRDQNRAKLASVLANKKLPASQTVDFGPDPTSNSQDFVIRETLPRWLKLPKVLISTMERYAQKSARKHHVQVTTNFSAGPQPTYIWGIPTDIIAKRLGSMTVTGPFNNVMAWTEDWNHAPLLAAVEGLTCTVAGDKGIVTGATSLVVYVFPEGKRAETTPVQTTSAGGGAMGGMMAGMMAGMAGAGAGGGATGGTGGGMPAKQ